MTAFGSRLHAAAFGETSLQIQKQRQLIRRSSHGARQTELCQVMCENAVDVIELRGGCRLLRLNDLDVVVTPASKRCRVRSSVSFVT